MLSPDVATDPSPSASIASAALAAEVQDDLLVAHNDLERLQRLLGDASESLIGHFHGAADQIKILLNETQTPAADAAALQSAMDHMARAITAMQFQDMASQLIDHSSRRLRRCADRIASEAMGDEDGEAVVEAAPLRPNPVTQDEMDAGSVDLF